MARTAMIWNKPTVKIADTEAGLAAGLVAECQINSAMLTPQPKTNTIPATGCAGESTSPGVTGWQLDLAWLQDWSAGDDTLSLSRYAFDHDTEPTWVQIVPNKDDATGSVLTGQFYVVAGGYGGTFGDGSAAATTATWPALDKPDIAAATVTP